MKTHYDNLQVAQNASQRVIRAAWKSLSQEWHPDKHPRDRQKAEQVQKIINRAYEVLSNTEARKQHDEWILSQQSKQKNQFKEKEDYREPNNTESDQARTAQTSSYRAGKQESTYKHNFENSKNYAERQIHKTSLLDRLSFSELAPALVGILIIILFFFLL